MYTINDRIIPLGSMLILKGNTDSDNKEFFHIFQQMVSDWRNVLRLKCFTGQTFPTCQHVRGHRLQCICVPLPTLLFVSVVFERVHQWHHFSCSRAGMLMFQPMACRSKPQVNRLHDWFSSFHAVQHTIRL